MSGLVHFSPLWSTLVRNCSNSNKSFTVYTFILFDSLYYIIYFSEYNLKGG